MQCPYIKAQLGVITVEVALILSVALAPLFWISIEAARFYYQYNVTVKNVRTAARYLSSYSRAETDSDNNQYQKIATNIIKCGTPSLNGCQTSMITGLSNINVSYTFTSNENITGTSLNVSYVTVSVSNFQINYLSDVFKKALVTAIKPISATFKQAN